MDDRQPLPRTEPNEEEKYHRKKRRPLLDVEGPLLGVLTKAGEMILLNIAWLIGLVPVLTAGAATTSLYYACVKSVRRGRGYPLSEFWRSVKRTFGKGAVISAAAVLWGYALWRLFSAAASLQSTQGSFLVRLYTVLAVLTVILLLYLFPVLSRFEMKLSGCLKLAFVMSVRYWWLSLLMAAVLAAAGWLYVFWLPHPAILFLPGLYCYGFSFPMEKVLRHYMPEPDEASRDEWYYE